MQLLLVDQLQLAEKRIFEGEEPHAFPELINPDPDNEEEPPSRAWDCNCHFWNSYQLPCQHLLQLHAMFHVITASMWKTYQFMFDECGLEVYESAGKDYITEAIFTEVGAPERRLEARQRVDQVINRYFSLEEEADAAHAAGEPDPARGVRLWLDLLLKYATRLDECSLGQLIEADRGVRPSLNWVQDDWSDLQEIAEAARRRGDRGGGGGEGLGGVSNTGGGLAIVTVAITGRTII